MELLNGKKINEEILNEVAAEVSALTARGSRPPHLVAILAGDNPASETYVGSKIKSCEKVGFRSTMLRFPSTVTADELIAAVDQLNADPEVDGILVQLPLPGGLPETLIIERIAASKDVDGFHPENIGKMTKGLQCLLPATPGGVMELLRRYQIETKGKHCVVVGRSNIVGTPMAILMSRDAQPGNCTVTLTHIFTENLAQYTRTADILIVAVGKVNLITADMVKPGAVVVDVGINRISTSEGKKKIVGDVDFEAVAPLCSHITPVPGGVGPMTIAQLLLNTLRAYEARMREAVQ